MCLEHQDIACVITTNAATGVIFDASYPLCWENLYILKLLSGPISLSLGPNPRLIGKQTKSLFGLNYTVISFACPRPCVPKAFHTAQVLTLAYGKFFILMKDDLSNVWWFLE